MSADFDVTVTVSDDSRPVVTVTVSGEFDAARVADFEQHTAPLPQETLRKTSPRTPLQTPCVIVDLVRTSVIDSSGLGALIRFRDRCVAVGVDVRTLIGSPYQATLMTVTGLDDLLGVERISTQE